MKARFVYGLMAVMLFVAGQASAVVLTSTDTRYLGLVEFGIPSGDAERTSYVNYLIDMQVNTSDTALGQDFTRSGNYSPDTLGTATFGTNGTGTSITNAGYEYLFAKYDGPNFGAWVWYVGGLTDITIPATGGGHDLSSWTLFNGASVCAPTDPTCNPSDVPEPGVLVLLGLGLFGLGMARRKVRS